MEGAWSRFRMLSFCQQREPQGWERKLRLEGLKNHQGGKLSGNVFSSLEGLKSQIQIKEDARERKWES